MIEDTAESEKAFQELMDSIKPVDVAGTFNDIFGPWKPLVSAKTAESLIKTMNADLHCKMHGDDFQGGHNAD